MDALPWQEFRHRLDHFLTPQFQRGVHDGALVSSPHARERLGRVIRVKQVELDFDRANPHAIRFASTQSAALVTAITEQTRRAIQRAVTRGVAGHLDPAGVERLIRDVIGLNDRQAAAILNLRRNLEAAGMSPLRIRAQVARARAKALRFRAEMIARTETMRSVNMGQLALWLAARDAGMFSTTQVTRRWVVTPDDRLCPFCAAMEGRTAAFDEQFRSVPIGRKRGIGFRTFPDVLTPPLHPLCRCTMVLDFLDEVPVLVGETEADRIRSAEDALVGNDVETAVVWREGEEVFRKKGEKDNVTFTNPETATMLGGDVFTHNHPRGTALSVEDAIFGFFLGLKEMRAVGSAEGQRYLYRLTFPGWVRSGLDFTDRSARLVDLRRDERLIAVFGDGLAVNTSVDEMIQKLTWFGRDADETLRSQIRPRFLAGDFGDPNDPQAQERATRQHSHRKMQQLANHFGFTYERILIP